MKARKKRVTTTLSPAEQRDFARVRKFLVSYCGAPVPASEVLRFLVRDWKAP